VSAFIPWEFIAATVGAVAALLAAWITGRRSASVRAKNRGLQEAIKAHEVRNEVENRIASERDALQRLRDDWQR
jgi:gas vesicle protein